MQFNIRQAKYEPEPGNISECGIHDATVGDIKPYIVRAFKAIPVYFSRVKNW